MRVLMGAGPAVAAGAWAATAFAASGGTAYVATPAVKSVKCMASCMSHARVQNGGKVLLRGSGFADVSRVIFRGARGTADDLSVRVTPSSDTRVAVHVPMRAQSGPIDAWASKKAHGATKKAVRIMRAPAPPPTPPLSPVSAAGGSTLETATSRTIFALDQRGGVKFSFRFKNAPASVTVSLVSLDDAKSVKTWTPRPVAGQVASVRWNGLVGKRAAPLGRYAFRLV